MALEKLSCIKLDVREGIVWQPEKGYVCMQYLQRADSPDSGLVVFSTGSGQCGPAYKAVCIFIKTTRGTEEGAVPAQVMVDGSQRPHAAIAGLMQAFERILISLFNN